MHFNAAARARAECGIVRHDDQRHATRVQFFEQAHDFDAGGTIEIAGRFVGQKQRRPHDRGARDRHSLALPTRQLIGTVLGAVCQARSRRAPAARVRRVRSATIPASIIGSAMFSVAVRRGTR